MDQSAIIRRITQPAALRQSLGNELPPQAHRQQPDGRAVQAQVKNVQRLGERALAQHAQFFDQVRLRRDRRHRHPGRQRNQDDQGDVVEPAHA